MANVSKNSDHAKLESVALSVFNQMTVSQGRGYDHKNTSLEAFRRAKAFIAVSEEIELGDLSADPIEADKPEFVDCPMLVQRGDEKWEKVMDEKTGKQVVQSLPVDRYAFAPNLPDDHPINVRFKPRDGVSASKRVASRN